MDKDQSTSVDPALERYRIRYGFYKVIVGTMIVGLAGVLVPGAVEFWQAYFDDQRKTLEIRLSQTNKQQEYVKDFLETALNQDIELRLRFADYFAHVAAEEFKQDWINFRNSLIRIRNETRLEIHDKELALRLADPEPDVAKQAEIAQLERALEWQYREVGYVAKDRSVVRSKSEARDRATGGSLTIDVDAGPIWNNDDAKAKCPGVCSGLQWNGQWTTTQQGVTSVCGTTAGVDIPIGPIWNNGDANRKCPAQLSKMTWNGQWTTTQEGKKSFCGCNPPPLVR